MGRVAAGEGFPRLTKNQGLAPIKKAAARLHTPRFSIGRYPPPSNRQSFQRTPIAYERLISVVPKFVSVGLPASANL